MVHGHRIVSDFIKMIYTNIRNPKKALCVDILYENNISGKTHPLHTFSKWYHFTYQIQCNWKAMRLCS